jgi:hypothetical protein
MRAPVFKRSILRIFYLLTASALLSSGVAVSARASAVSISIDGVAGAWTSVSGSPSALTGLNSNQISFGQPATIGGPQSSYLFQSSGLSGPFSTGNTFNLGAFTHFNLPIYGNSITGATLSLTVSGHTSDGSTFSLTSSFLFHHNETPNIGPAGCCDDIVTALLNPVNSQILSIDGANYRFGFGSFLVGGLPMTEFRTVEGLTNSATILGSLEALEPRSTASPVPGPMAGGGGIGILVLGCFFVCMRRRQTNKSDLIAGASGSF